MLIEFFDGQYTHYDAELVFKFAAKTVFYDADKRWKGTPEWAIVGENNRPFIEQGDSGCLIYDVKGKWIGMGHSGGPTLLPRYKKDLVDFMNRGVKERLKHNKNLWAYLGDFGLRNFDP